MMWREQKFVTQRMFPLSLRFWREEAKSGQIFEMGLDAVGRRGEPENDGAPEYWNPETKKTLLLRIEASTPEDDLVWSEFSSIASSSVFHMW